MTTRTIVSYREHDLRTALQLLAAGHCVAVVGLSNLGKSSLLRSLQLSEAIQLYESLAGVSALFVYVDCNRMLELSPRGFFEATLRAVLEALPADETHLRAAVEVQYRMVVEPPNDFAAPLAFNDALVTLVEEDTRRVVLLLDEFDEVLTGIEPRILLNLRALRDKYGPDLSFVMASVMPPSLGADDDYVAEFSELFSDGRVFLGPLTDEEARRMAADIFTAVNDSLDEPEGDYLVAQAGGHPGLIQTVARVLLQVESGAPQLYQQQAFALANTALEHDRQARLELTRIWNQLTETEREILVDFATQRVLPDEARVQLAQRGLLRPVPEGAEEETEPRLFSGLFQQFVRRMALTQRGVPAGVWVDTDAGEVWVDGQPVSTLTDLEYRLLLLLYGRLDKICDKYQLVETVWGEEYIDEVDDARIEKLVSRLRAKLEEPPDTGRYLVTVRGRGYKLSGEPEAAS
jgi:DNA-binding winged helix-turn-helix (wHTH) protein